ncbi:hypothetical protein KOR42_23920 [Thalassoglobus neptunius]|uniref:Uncharacterized protein n=1 Tax=Thalassoglobus neptunius TaxID=1938619 RepID=A0A5C5X9Z8_9PLAN|nr:hypothetical protein KOR42_23920 [Thalassoglobus neptunius]
MLATSQSVFLESLAKQHTEFSQKELGSVFGRTLQAAIDAVAFFVATQFYQDRWEGFCLQQSDGFRGLVRTQNIQNSCR